MYEEEGCREKESAPSSRIQINHRDRHRPDVESMYGLVGREGGDPRRAFDTRDEERVVVGEEAFVCLLEFELEVEVVNALSQTERVRPLEGKCRISRR